MNSMNKYDTLREAVLAAQELLDKDELLDDGADLWDVYNLLDAVADEEPVDGYYCVGYDGRIGYTEDNGTTVKWIYTVTRRIPTLISLAEYAEKHGKALSSVRQMAQRGSLKTARKIGRNWVIDADEPYPDRRIKSGKYVGRKKERKK